VRYTHLLAGWNITKRELAWWLVEPLQYQTGAKIQSGFADTWQAT
jgi:hypothetical protein